jgi:hypothetical protein
MLAVLNDSVTVPSAACSVQNDRRRCPVLVARLELKRQRGPRQPTAWFAY